MYRYTHIYHLQSTIQMSRASFISLQPNHYHTFKTINQFGPIPRSSTRRTAAGSPPAWYLGQSTRSLSWTATVRPGRSASAVSSSSPDAGSSCRCSRASATCRPSSTTRLYPQKRIPNHHRRRSSWPRKEGHSIRGLGRLRRTKITNVRVISNFLIYYAGEDTNE